MRFLFFRSVFLFLWVSGDAPFSRQLLPTGSADVLQQILSSFFDEFCKV